MSVTAAAETDDGAAMTAAGSDAGRSTDLTRELVRYGINGVAPRFKPEDG